MPMTGCSERRTVLLADDDVNYITSFARDFGPEWRILSVHTVEDALDMATQERLDLAVVELRLGSSSGIELIRALRNLDSNIKIALVSGYLSVSFAVTSLRAGADIALFKPVSATELLRHLKDPNLLSHGPAEAGWDTPSLARAEWEHITRVLNDCEGNVSMAARKLGLYRQSLQRRLRKYSPRT